MKLALSSAAAPDASLAELADAARRRGLHALELVEGHAHGLVPPGDDHAVTAALPALRERGVGVAVLRCGTPGTAHQCGPAAVRLGALVALPGAAMTESPDQLRSLQATGVSPLLAFGDPGQLLAAGAAPAGAAASYDFAWDVVPGAYDLEAAAAEVVRALAGRLRHVRLHGGGPEAVAQEGLGVGALMRELALAGFAGSFAVAPSAQRYRLVWSAWLGRRGGWGCGGKAGAHASLPTAVLEDA